MSRSNKECCLRRCRLIVSQQDLEDQQVLVLLLHPPYLVGLPGPLRLVYLVALAHLRPQLRPVHLGYLLGL